MAMGAEEIRCNHEAGISAFVMAVGAAFFGEGGVYGALLDTLLLFKLGCKFLLCGLNMIVPAVLLRRRHTGDAIKNSTGNLMHRQGIARTC